MQVEVCLLAYAKAVLHACKYPHKAVNGILLGSSDRSTAKTTLIDVQDAVPLSHLALGLTPMLELALTQVREEKRRRNRRSRVMFFSRLKSMQKKRT